MVAIGASAGGLEACRRLLDALPANPGMAFVFVQHLDPTHDSMLVELLSHHTAMRVVQAADGMVVQPDHVYVIPPGAYLAIRAETLLLSPPSARHGARMPFDHLLHSMAAHAGPRSACVVLSGTGADGSAGLQALHAAHGFIIAQEPMEAGFDGMPRSAIATGAVDQVLPIAEMPAALARFARLAAAAAGGAEHGERPGDWLTAIIELLRQQTPHDFRLYKPGTLRRRIMRRMSLAGIEAARLDRYHAMLTTDAAQRDLLAKDLLINVTGFFRDPEIFDFLAAETIPALVDAHREDRPIRVWVPGCSTGEEAYSLAMLFQEHLVAIGRHAKLQIFASDIDEDAILLARDGLYPASIAADVSAARLQRFFVQEDHGYRVVSDLRASVIFTVQDVLADPPFSRLDLVSCRNLLIYLRPEAQNKVVALFHFALRNGGVLLLGGSETIANAESRFEVISKMAKLYRKIGRSRPQDFGFPSVAPDPARPQNGAARGQPPPRQAVLAELCRRLVMDAYAPAAVLINDKNECLFSLGPTDRYLRIAPGQPSFDLPSMARQETRTKLRSAIQQARQHGERVVVAGGRLTHQGGTVAFSLVVQPVLSEGERLLLICFVEEAARPSAPVGAVAAVGEQDRPRLAELEHELDTTRAELQGAIRNLEIAHEEQKAITEETLSANEEFQSTNEELTTSKEELQSLNEELTALNSQLQETLERQRTTANDLQNVLYSTDVATLFLDGALNIRLFTPALRTVFKVIPGDIGRPLADLRPVVADPTLLVDARGVLRTQHPIEREIETEAGIWFSRRIMPYRTQDHGVEGVVITFVDVTERKRVAAQMQAARQQAEQATAAKTRFLAAASHDLRQPLQTLTLVHGMLEKTVQSPASHRLTARLGTTLDTMADMLNSLLATNQIEAGTVAPEIAAFPIEPLLQRLHGQFLYQAQNKGIDLRLAPSSLVVRSDPALLEQMLRNLLANALKYTPKGKVLLGCRRHGDTLAIEVWDTGVGIAAESLELIFEEYRQLDTESSPSSGGVAQGGMGLGLSIVRRLGEMLGHAVTVRSWPGRGSVFTVAVGLETEAAEAVAEPSARAANGHAANGHAAGGHATGGGTTGGGGPGDSGPLRILLVEDNHDLRELLEVLLTDMGHSVRQAPDGLAALALPGGGQPPDIILTDYNLPNGLNGLQLVLKARRHYGREIPAIILTGDISTTTLREIAAADCIRLTKPVRLRELSAAMQLLLGPAAAATAPATAPSAPERAPAPAAPRNGSATGVIYVVDDDRAICEAIGEVFEPHGIAVEAYASGEAFLLAYRPGRAACLLVDAMLPGISGLELLRRLHAQGHDLPSIMLTGHGDLSMAVQAMRAGALDFITKPVSYQDLRSAVTQALDRARDSDKQTAWRDEATGRLAGLTPRQREIMYLVLAGHPSKNIAADLGISQRTVENHRAAIMHKSGAASLPALARLALAADGAAGRPADEEPSRLD